MSSDSIVKGIDVVGDVADRQLSVLVDLLLDAFFLQAAEERLGDRVVPTIALAAHARLEMIRTAESAPRIAAELGALIRMNQRASRSASTHGHQYGVEHQLQELSAIAAAAYAPFISAAGPQMFGVDTFSDLGGIRDLGAIVATERYASWQAFRESEHARFMALTLPRIPLRRPAGEQRNKLEGQGQSDFVWGNAAYAFAVCLAKAFARDGWCARIRGLEGGGLVEGLDAITTEEENGDHARRVTEILITDRREAELARLGMIPLVGVGGRDCAVFFSTNTCARPQRFIDDVETTASWLKHATRVRTGGLAFRPVREMCLA